MTSLRLVVAMIGSAFLLATLLAVDASARSCADRGAGGACQARAAKDADTSGPLKLLSFLAGSKEQPAKQTRQKQTRQEPQTARPRAASSTRTYARHRRTTHQARTRVAHFRRGAPQSDDFRDAEEANAAATTTVRTRPVASNPPPAPTPAPAAAIAPIASSEPVADVAHEASAVPNGAADPRSLSEIDMTAGSGAQEAASSPPPVPTPDRSWLGGLLAVLGGALAAASAARFVLN
jgi:hypothetical protein